MNIGSIIQAIGILAASATVVSAQQPCSILVIDQENGWPVPLVQLKTTHQVCLYTDNAGRVAFDLPEFMGQETWLHLESDGYGVQPDGFGFRGVRIVPQPGKQITIRVTRQMLAKRIGRLTGAGLFAESQRSGQHDDWSEQGITGCDTVRIAQHNGRLHWIWGDTNLPRYPLGLFHTLGATTKRLPLDSFQPPLKLRFDYFRDDQQRPRNTATMPGDGPTWLDAPVSLHDKQGQNRLGAYYVKVRKFLDVYETGLCVWNETTRSFDQHKVLWNAESGNERPASAPQGHVTRWTDQDGESWLLFGDPFPKLKCHPTLEAWSDPGQWHVIQSPEKIRCREGGEAKPHRGSIMWNAVRNKWLCVFCETGGQPSPLGEIWYTESQSPLGPWEPAVKILSHQNYSFYNPRIDNELIPTNAEFILFEGTYTKMFSNNPVGTPRYDYNQILYRLDFKDIAPFFSSTEK